MKVGSRTTNYKFVIPFHSRKMAIEMQCDYCGKSFRVKRVELAAKQFGLKQSLTCSKECGYAIHRGRPVPKRYRRVELNCEQCGNSFVETQAHAQTRRFCSIECKARYQETTLRGENNPFFGRKHSQETIERIKETRLYQFGDRNPNWRGGVTELKKLIRKSKKSKQWRDAVYKRDNYRSVESGRKGRSTELVAHHVKPFVEILHEFLALDSALDVNSDRTELCKRALEYEPFWEVSNGKTLLRDEHQPLHSRQLEINDDEN